MITFAADELRDLSGYAAALERTVRRLWDGEFNKRQIGSRLNRQADVPDMLW